MSSMEHREMMMATLIDRAGKQCLLCRRYGWIDWRGYGSFGHNGLSFDAKISNWRSVDARVAQESCEGVVNW